MTFEELVLWVHVSAVVAGLGALFANPVLLSVARRSEPPQAAVLHRVQLRLGSWLGSPGLLLVLLAGAYLASTRDLWTEVWVVVPLVIVLVIGGLNGSVLAPRQRRLAELAQSGGGAEYERMLRQVSQVTVVVLALVLLAAFFMITKVGD